MNKYHIELVPAEAELVSKIDFRSEFPLGEDLRTIYLANAGPVLELITLLLERSAFPKRRWDLWTDPALKAGRTKGSYQDLWRRGGSTDDEAFTDLRFLPFLRFFIFGADLPEGAIAEIEDQIGNPEWFSGSDILGLTKRTRMVVRKFGLLDSRYPEEFLKLALDNGLNNYNSMAVRNAAVAAARK